MKYKTYIKYSSAKLLFSLYSINITVGIWCHITKDFGAVVDNYNISDTQKIT